jgi:hypothetical protein
MATATGLLAVWMQIPAEGEADLNDWYTKEHLPERIAIPGFLSALRYVSLEGEPKYMALYDLETPSVLYSDGYIDMRRNSTDWTRRIGQALEKNVRHEYVLMQSSGRVSQEPAPYVVLIRLGGEEGPRFESALGQAVESKAGATGVRGARTFKALVGSPRYLVYLELEDERVYGGTAWTETEPKLQELRSQAKDWSVNYGRFLEAADFAGTTK